MFCLRLGAGDGADVKPPPCSSAAVKLPTCSSAAAFRLKLDGPYDSRALPIILAVTLVTSLVIVFSGAVVRLQSDSL